MKNFSYIFIVFLLMAGFALGDIVGMALDPVWRPQVHVTVRKSVMPTVSEKVFLLQRDNNFRQLYAHWRACSTSMAHIETLAIRERYDAHPVTRRK